MEQAHLVGRHFLQIITTINLHYNNRFDKKVGW